MKLSEVPYSYRGSYMAFSEILGGFNGKRYDKGLYFRSIHGSSQTSLVAKITPVFNGKEIEYTTSLKPHMLTVLSENGKAEITFYDAKTILIRGNLSLSLDFMTENRAYTYLVPQDLDNKCWLADCYGENCRYVFLAQKGKISVEQEWKGCNARKSVLTVSADSDGEYLVALEENYEEWTNKNITYNFDEALEKCRNEFASFKSLMPEIPDEYAALSENAAYVNWASLVAPCGFLKREAMLMSKNWMCNVWSWDHCFNALALSYKYPKLAWDQFMIMFDHQTSIGSLPDSVNDSKVIHNYCKPPIHGWILKKLMKNMSLTDEQLSEAYDKLCRWTNWWLTCRDNNHDGLCEYNHGNDSGWDNSTVFAKMPPVTSPDLAAFLVLQMDVLSELAEKAGRLQESLSWKNKSDEMLDKLFTVLYKDGTPLALHGLENNEVLCDSLLLYIPIVLGERLPQSIRKNYIDVLKSDKFVTSHGFATESPKSKFYESDGYWRGPIWAPSTFIILDGLSSCKEDEFVKQMAKRFCDMMCKSGCAENFDAISGEGLRDRAYTWTASVMFVLAHEYLL